MEIFYFWKDSYKKKKKKNLRAFILWMLKMWEGSTADSTATPLRKARELPTCSQSKDFLWKPGKKKVCFAWDIFRTILLD